MDAYNVNIFMSGPMTGLPSYNVGSFATVHQRLIEGTFMGRYVNDIYDPAQEYLNNRVSEPEVAMRYSIASLSSGKYDVLLLLPGWENSKGARLEREVAMAIGMKVTTLDELEEKGYLA